MPKYESAIYQWITSQININVELKDSDIPNKLKEVVSTINRNDWYYHPMFNYTLIRFSLLLDPAAYTILSVKGTVYDHDHDHDRDHNATLAIIYVNSLGSIEYICCGASPYSRDGEWRDRFMTPRAIDTLFDKLDPISTLVSKKLQSIMDLGDFTINITKFGAIDRTFELVDLDSVILRIISLQVILFHSKLNIIKESKYYAVLQILSNYVVLDPLSKDMHDTLKLFELGIRRELQTPVGQKLQPLTVSDVAYPDNLIMGVRRESAIGKLINLLIANGNTGASAYTIAETLVESTSKDLYDNPAMHDRYDRSVVTTVISNELRDIISTLESHKITPLIVAVRNVISLIQRSSQLTDISLLRLSEHTGMSISHLKLNIEADTYTHKHLLDIESLAFITSEIMFGLSAIHHIGIIHGDIHPGNITIARRSAPKSDKSVGILYIYNYHAYIIPTHCDITHTSRLIDFSRAILCPQVIQYIPGMRTDFHYYTSDQLNASFRFINQHIPDYVDKNIDQLTGLAYSNPEKYYKVLSAIDFIAACGVFKHVEKFFTDAGWMSLDRGIDVARSFVITSFRKLFTSPDYIVPDINHMVLNAMFGDLEVKASNVDKTHIYGYFRPDRPLTYKLGEHPPWGEYEQVSQHMGDMRFGDGFGGPIERVATAADERIRMEIIAEKERSKYNPIPITSSYI